VHKFLYLITILGLFSNSAIADGDKSATLEISSIDMIKHTEQIHPVSRILRSEFKGCKSEIQRDAVIFKNIGSMCVDGMYTLMLGRGCNTIVGEKDPSGRWTVHKCLEKTTCDILHQNSFAAVPVGISIADNFEPTVQIFCQDNNYIIVKL